jgi:hypothetical protein
MMEERQGPFKIWRNPGDSNESPKYMGEAYAPVGQLCLRATDLRSLGFATGSYTILVPESLTFLYDMPKWEELDVTS